MKYFKNTPGRAPIERQALSVNFFFQIRNEVPEKKVPSPPQRAHPWGDRGLSPVGGATGPFFSRDFFFQGPILCYSSVYSSLSSARSRPLTPTARNLSFIKSREKNRKNFPYFTSILEPTNIISSHQ